MKLIEIAIAFKGYLRALNEKCEINVNDHIESFFFSPSSAMSLSSLLTVIELSHLLDVVTLQIQTKATITKKAFLQLSLNLLVSGLARFDFSASLFNYLAQILWRKKWQEQDWKFSGFTEVLHSSTEVLGKILQWRSWIKQKNSIFKPLLMS